MKYLTLLLLLASCSSTTFETKVVERIGNKDETPEWATGSKAMWQDGAHVYYSSFLELDGNSRPTSCLEASMIDAKSNMLRYINENLTSYGSLNREGLENNPTYESLQIFLAQGRLHGVQVDEKYWERVLRSNANGSKEIKLRCTAKVKIKKDLLKKQLKSAMGENNEKSNPIKDKLLKAQESFIANLSE